ncbi:MAG: aldehyde dehydrogenase family protein [Pirellulaceae bacterium]|nr:aldehyde dehydrogenase family protein [Pirellulaceae bacterium]
MASELKASPSASAANAAVLDVALQALASGAQRLPHWTLNQRAELLDRCADGVLRSARDWVEVACRAKRIAVDSPVAAEEILAGPVCVLRYLRLLSRTLKDIERRGAPKLPGSPSQNTQGRTHVPVLPVAWLYDSLIFMGLQAEVWLEPQADRQLRFELSNNTSDAPRANIAGVLGAGNVSAIGATDMLAKIFQEGEVVLLKLNPVNEYLEPVFNLAFEPLIAADMLRIVRGDGSVGQAIVEHPQIDSLHLTGSHVTHEIIVWGADPTERARRQLQQQPLVTKPVTSELGNVTPWIIVPGRFSARQLDAQAAQLVASIVNNASFNCLATKVIVTSRQWSQRGEFLDLLETKLKRVPPRYAYYPGARQRFELATGFAAPESGDGCLPWTIVRDADPLQSPHLFRDESFVCVCAETALDADTPQAFLEAAVAFVNDQLFGTLCANLTLPADFEKRESVAVERALAELRYGTVSINQWAGVVYGLMTPPWGGFPGATLSDPQSGIGQVHNTFGIKSIEKTVLRGPLCSLLKPAWFANHRTAHRTAWALLEFYHRPSVLRLPRIINQALRG